jgi:hypothetical protein
MFLTILLGLSRLPGAFQPFIKKDLTLGREIERIEHVPEGDGKVKLFWKKKFTDTTFQEATYDYAVISAPLPIVRRWRLPREWNSLFLEVMKWGCLDFSFLTHFLGFSTTLRHAIHNLAYANACKVI